MSQVFRIVRSRPSLISAYTVVFANMLGALSSDWYTGFYFTYREGLVHSQLAAASYLQTNVTGH